MTIRPCRKKIASAAIWTARRCTPWTHPITPEAPAILPARSPPQGEFVFDQGGGGDDWPERAWGEWAVVFPILSMRI